MYKLTTKVINTGEIIKEEIYEHWPCKEAWDIELTDYNLKCEIQRI